MTEHLPVVTPADLPAQRVRCSLSTYRWLFGDDGWILARRSAPAIERALAEVEPRWIDHLSAWAAAAGADLADLLIINARSEVLSVVRSGQRRGECTVVAEPGRVGQTWDWYGRQQRAMVVLRAEGYVTLTEAGMLAKLGVNRHGLAVGLMFLASSSDGLPVAGTLPVHAVLRLLLERSSNVADAILRIDQLRFAGSACIALADDRDSALVEITPAGRAVLPGGVHTNHCLDAGLRSRQGAIDFLDDSEDRLARATMLHREGTALEDLLADTAGGCSAIDQPPDPLLVPHDRTETVLAVVIDARHRLLRIAPGRPSQTGFTQVVALDEM